MAGAPQRGYKAGKAFGEALVEQTNLMYQNNTIAHYYRGLDESLQAEMERRHLNHQSSGREVPRCEECHLPNPHHLEGCSRR